MLWSLVFISLVLLLILVMPCGRLAGDSLALWGGTLSIVMIAWGYFCSTQYLMGCGFSLAECYGADIPEWHNLGKLISVVAFYIWCVAGVLKLISRTFRFIKTR